MDTEIVHSSIQTVPVRILPELFAKNLPSSKIGQTFCNMHLHDELELVEAVVGNTGIHVNNRSYSLLPKESILIKSRVPHQTYALSHQSTHRCIQFLPDLLSDIPVSREQRFLSRFINSGEVYIFKLNDPVTKEVHSCLKNIVTEYKKKQASYETYIKANLYLLLGCFYRNGILNNADNFFDRFELGKILPLLKYIDENYSEQISLKNAGEILSLNPDYLCRLFKKTTNMTFTDYLNFVRICHTEKPLIFSDKTISEISLDAGFSSVSYFNRVFKKYKNISPSEYRRSKYANQ